MNKLEVADQNEYESNYFAIELIGHVAHIKLNRPEKRNAMNWDFWRDLPGIIAVSYTHLTLPTIYSE